MNLFNKLLFKLKYFWHTWRVSDEVPSVIQIPYMDEEGNDHTTTIHVNGQVFKTFIHVILTLEMDPRWNEEHIDALAEFLINYPELVDQTTLLAFLHPEFYEDWDDDDVEIELV